jgi:hypothetical protein
MTANVLSLCDVAELEAQNLQNYKCLLKAQKPKLSIKPKTRDSAKSVTRRAF